MSYFVEANVNSIAEKCYTADLSKLEQYVENNFGQGFGLDFCFDDQKRTLLHILAGNLQFEHWELILKCFVYVNSPDISQQTPLHIAVLKKNIRAMKALISAGASLTTEDEHGNNPIQLACIHNFQEGLKLMLETSNGKNFLSSNFISTACLCFDNKAIDSFKLVIRSVPESKLNEKNDEGNALIHCTAAQKTSKKFLKALLELNVDLNLKNAQNLSPIECVSDEKYAALFLSKGDAFIKHICLSEKKAQFFEKIFGDSNCANIQSNNEIFVPYEIHKMVFDNEPAGISSFKNVNVVDCFHYSPLMYAVEYDKKECCDALLKKDANPNFPSTKYKSNANNAYHLAALNGKSQMIQEFKKKFKPDFSYLDKHGRNLILCSVLSGDPSTVSELISEAPENKFDSQLFNEIIKVLFTIEDDNALAEITKLLISKGLPSQSHNEHGESLIVYAIETGKTKFAQVLLENGALTEMEADDCIISAVRNDYSDIVSELLKHNVNVLVMYQGWPLLHYVVNHKTLDTLEILYKKNSQIKEQKDTKENTFLHRAAHSGNFECIKFAIETMGIDINAVNKQGETPLHLLMNELSQQWLPIYKYLVEKGANLEILDSMDNNILHFAANNNNKYALDMLLGLDSDEQLLDNDLIDKLISQKNSEGKTPLEVASKHNDLSSAFSMNKKWQLAIFDAPVTEETFQEFSQMNLSPNVKDMKRTPLITYVMNNCQLGAEKIYEFIENLLLFGADPSIPDADNLTPLHHAIALNYVKIASLLINGGSSFIVEPVIHVFAEEKNLPEMLDLIKQPEKRASAVDEFLQTQINSVQYMKCILKFRERFQNTNENLTINFYMDEIQKFHRLLSLFVDRLKKISHNMKPLAEFGPFFIYFADAFIPLLNIPTAYHDALNELQQAPELQSILTESIGFNNYNLNDALIVPVQQFTRYHELIRAIIKATPADHPDILQLQRAHLKYSNLGRASNERMLIAESRGKLEAISLKSTLNKKNSTYNPNDILLYHGLFEKKSSQTPVEGTRISESYEWGLKTNQVQCGKINVQYFTTFGKSLKSFMKSQKIGIFLFSKIALFGLQKSEDSFKIKFSCHSSEILWDFSKSHGPDSFQIWTPIGQFCLKIEPPKGSTGDFEKTQWKSNVEKLSKIDESEMETVGGREICYVSWAGKETHCVHSKLFSVQCENKEEAKKKILEKMEQLGIPIETKQNPLGGTDPLISYCFQTHCPPQGQVSDIFSDINLL